MDKRILTLSHKVISAINQDSVFDLISKFGDHMKNVLIYDRIAQGIQDFCANNSIDEVCNTEELCCLHIIHAGLQHEVRGPVAVGPSLPQHQHGQALQPGAQHSQPLHPQARHSSGHCSQLSRGNTWSRAAKDPLVLTITEKAPIRAFSWLKGQRS